MKNVCRDLRPSGAVVSQHRASDQPVWTAMECVGDIDWLGYRPENAAEFEGDPIAATVKQRM